MSEILTDKDLHCIARHIQQHIKENHHDEKTYICCEVCDYVHECINEDVQVNDYLTIDIIDPYESLGKLSRITGVNISPSYGFKL